MALLHEHDAIVRARAGRARRNGEVKHTGDGIMASVGSSRSAVQPGREPRRSRCSDASASETVLLAQPARRSHRYQCRMSRSATHDDLFGATVAAGGSPCARRADPRGITVSVAVRELCVGTAIPAPRVRGPVEDRADVRVDAGIRPTGTRRPGGHDDRRRRSGTCGRGPAMAWPRDAVDLAHGVGRRAAAESRCPVRPGHGRRRP